MSKSNRRHHSPEDKGKALRRHHVDKVAVSDICDEMKIQPSLFYHWQRSLFENADTVFAGAQSRKHLSTREEKLEAEVAALKEKLGRRDEVIAGISEEFVNAKKAIGGP